MKNPSGKESPYDGDGSRYLNTILILNIIIPLLLGGILYYVFCPDIILVQQLDSFLPVAYYIHRHPELSGSFPQILRNHFFDFLWAYAFTVSILYWGKDHIRAKQLLLLILITEGTLEALQLLSFIHGTFDVLDVIVEYSISIIVIITFFTRRTR